MRFFLHVIPHTWGAIKPPWRAAMKTKMLADFQICVSVPLRSSHPEVFCQKMFLKILQNSQKNIFARISFLITLQAGVLRACNFQRWFPKKIAKFLRTTILKNICKQLLLSWFKKRLQHRCLPVNFVNYSWTSILKRNYERLVLKHRCEISL